MKKKVTKTFGFLKTTAIGGLIFLLPLAAISGLLGYVYKVVKAIYDSLESDLGPVIDRLPVSSIGATSLLFLIAVGILVVLCFLCGLAARRAIARRFSQAIEKHLVMVFPKYAIYKDILAGNIGGDSHSPTLAPVTIEFDDMIRIGYEAGRTDQGLVIAYLPGSPDPWLGSVVLVRPGQIQPLDVNFGETSGICERLGRDSEQLLSSVRMAASPPASGQPPESAS